MKNGLWKFYDRKGKLLRQTEYKMGEDVKALAAAKEAEEKAKKADAAKKAAEAKKKLPPGAKLKTPPPATPEKK
ncbi:MAG TPA: hypothetical protein PLB72_08205 [Bacteroidia bacterium]|nr:hypothetical protein [Bacteroidia bacterium]